MSYTILKMFGRTGLVHIEEYRNSHGFAPMVWSALSKRYFRSDGISQWQRLWEEPPALEPWERVVLECTYDRALIYRKDVPKVVKALGQFSLRYDDPKRFNHLPAIAAAMLREAQTEGCVAFCFYVTSASDDLWQVRVEGSEDSRPYDLDVDTGHFVVNVEGIDG